MDRRFQVFVSSTFSDLQVERHEVLYALLEMNCIPSGMELFPAANDTTWQLIKRVIEESDYYLLIIGGRYGSIDVGGISYTEKEYKWARELEKPIAAFLHDDPGKIPLEKSDLDPAARAKLDAFRKLVESAHTCKYWSSAEDLGAKVSRSVAHLIRTNPSTGWVKANEAVPADVLATLERLRSENEGLQADAVDVERVVLENTSQLARGTELYEFTVTTSSDVRIVLRPAWDELFEMVGTMLFDGQRIDSALKQGLTARLRERLVIKGSIDSKERIKLFNPEFQRIKIQMMALGYIQKVRRRVGWTGWFAWDLTDEGRVRLVELLSQRTSAS